MALVPHRFLFRIAHPCLYQKQMPRPGKDRLLDLPAESRLENFAAIDQVKNFAQVSLAWNELGIGLQVEVRGKENAPVGDATRPRGSDGVTLWLDTRDSRTSHRASRYCHQFHFLATGGGPERDEPAVVQTRGCAFLNPFPGRPNRAGLLAYEGDALAHGLLVWQSEGDAYDRRLYFGAAPASALPAKPDPAEAWGRLWGTPGVRDPRWLNLTRTLDGLCWPLERLTLPGGVTQGADLDKLGLLKKAAKPLR